MRVARHLAAHGAQTEAFGGIIAGGFHPAIVKDQRFGPAPLEEKLSVIGARRGLAQQRQRGFRGDSIVEGAEFHIGHKGAFCVFRSASS